MRWTSTALGLLIACAATGPANAQSKSGAETSLVGIRLYDTGMRLVSVYGSPDEIYAVSVAGGAVGGAGGLGGGMGMPGGGNRGGMGMPGGGMGMPGGMSGMPGGISGVPPGAGRGMAPGGMGGPMGAPMGLIDTNNPFGFGDSLLKQLPPGARGGLQGGAGLQSAPPGMGGPTGMQMGMGGPPPGFSMGGGSPSGMGGVPGVPGRGGMGGGASMGMGMGAGNNAATQVATFTRWVYNRAGSKYGFILDKAGKVVQIEAVGMKNPKVRTRRGIGFGANFATIMKKYGSPDSYEISGDTILMKYLTRQKVAFRLSRLYEGKPQVVTGVVVAAGKS